MARVGAHHPRLVALGETVVAHGRTDCKLRPVLRSDRLVPPRRLDPGARTDFTAFQDVIVVARDV